LHHDAPIGLLRIVARSMADRDHVAPLREPAGECAQRRDVVVLACENDERVSAGVGWGCLEYPVGEQADELSARAPHGVARGFQLRA
jgi:hypothetical protein